MPKEEQFVHLSRTVSRYFLWSSQSFFFYLSARYYSLTGDVDEEACSRKEISSGTEEITISKSALKRLKKKQLWEQNKLERRYA